MNREQLTKHVIRPTLQAIPKGWSAKAELAILMIIAHESLRGEYIAQIGHGPAKGIIQMEGWVHDDVWTNSDSIKPNATLLGYDPVLCQSNSDMLCWDLRYNVFMARQRLFMDPNPLPETPEEMSVYLKKFWNSDMGLASDDSYLSAYSEWK